MNFPGFTAEESLYNPEVGYLGAATDTQEAGVQPQLQICTPCVAGRKGCCWTRLGWPPFACGLKTC